MSSPQKVPPPPNPVGVWFCQISSSLQRRRPGGQHAEMKGAADEGKQEQQLREGSMNDMDAPRRTTRTSAATCRSSTAMTENTVCLLLDRFAPS